jgi:hypothetical protein
MVWLSHENGTAELLDRLQNEKHKGKVDADQSTHGRTELGTECKEEISRLENVSTERSGGRKKIHHWVCFHRKIYIYCSIQPLLGNSCKTMPVDRAADSL